MIKQLCQEVGVVGGEKLLIESLIDLPLSELAQLWCQSLAASLTA